MKIYELIFVDSFEANGGEWNGTTFNFVSKYIVNLSNWLLILFTILIVPIIEIVISSLTKFLSQVWNKCLNNSNKHIYLNDTIQRIISSEPDIMENDNILSEEHKSYQHNLQAQKVILPNWNEFSEAFRYLCTCKPGNKILARKPIKIQ